ncbi:MAG: cytochrome c biogenesis protein CcsA [Chromatiales bacterium]|nr:cytochrome c biogenesis protein CcsA [Chromatiales bacterium]
MDSSVFALATVASYLSSTLYIAFRLFRRQREHVPPRAIGIVLGMSGVVFHSIYLYLTMFTGDGVNLGFFSAASSISWIILVLLMLSSLSKPVENLGIPLFPLAIASIVLQTQYPSAHFLAIDTPWMLRIHVLISMLAYSLLTLASVQAVLLAIQDHHLRNRHPGGFIRALPPLQTMEQLLFEMIGLGFALLTIALISGFLFLEHMFAQHLVHKTILSLTAWVVFGTLLWGRFRYGWRGQKALTWTLVGFVVLMLAYFGSKFVLELVLTV